MRQFILVPTSVLQVRKLPIQTLAGLADHYYLSETPSLDNSLGWGPAGLELRGIVRITEAEMSRVEEFLNAHCYNINIYNCEHFANYVLYGLPLSSQRNTPHKNLGSFLLSLIQPTNSIRENKNEIICQQAADILNENLRQAKIQRANEERIRFWAERGVEVQ